MNSQFKGDVCPQYRLLTEVQIQEIHRATLEVLETVGVKVKHPKAVEMMKNAGCKIRDGDIVLIPNWMVEEAIQSVPSRINLYNQKGEIAMQLEGKKTHFGLGTDLKYTVDLETGKTRLSVLQDVRNANIVADACSNIDFLASFALPSDVPTNLMYLQCVKAQMEVSEKPIFFTSAGAEDLQYILKMAETIVGGEQQLAEKPFLIHYSEPTAPLMHSYGAVEKLFLCADRELPICYVPGVLMGATGPVTLAGGIVQANAEALSGIVLQQIRHKGAPIVSGWAVVPLDMKTMVYCYGAPDFRLTNTAFADIYHYYGIPCWSILGSDAHCLDQQAGFEHGIGLLMTALDGANLIHDVGYLGQGLLGNPASIVMGDEIISYVKRILRGFEISRETLAVEIMKKVGPGGDFFSQDHTLKNFKQELWRPSLINRDPPDRWQKKGGKTYGERCVEKAKEFIKNYNGTHLSELIQAKLNIVAKEAEEKLKDFKFPA